VNNTQKIPTEALFFDLSDSTTAYRYKSDDPAKVGPFTATEEEMNSKGQLSLHECNLVHRLMVKGSKQSCDYFFD